MTLLEIALSNLAVAVILALLAATASLWRGRCPALVHLLWVLVLVKLVTPPLVRVPLPWPTAVPASPLLPEDNDTVAFWVPVEPASDDKAEEVLDPAGKPSAVEVDAPPPEQTPRLVSPWPWIAGLWLAGAFGWYALAWRRSREFSRLLCLGRPPSDAMSRRVARLASQLGVRPPRIAMLPGRLPPMVWGAISPLLVLPEGIETGTNDEGLDTLLMHELAHIRRGDPWVRWLEAAALGPWWWCPLAWLASRELRAAEEQCCDAWVVRMLPGKKKAYATALVDVLDFLAGVPSPPLMASGLGPVADLKRRLTMILNGVTPARMGRPASLGVLCLAALVLPLVPALSNAQAPPPADVIKNKDVLLLLGDEKGKAIEFELVLDEGKVVKAAAGGLEAELAKKLAEVEAIKKKIAWIKANPVKAPPEGKPAVTIHIHISGMDRKHADIEALTKKLREVFPGDAKIQVEMGKGVAGLPVPPPGPRGVILKLIEDKKGGIFRVAPEDVKGVFKFPLPPDGTPHPKPPFAVPVPPPAKARGVEERLDALMKEMEALRRELKGSR